MKNLINTFFLLLIRCYQWILSPLKVLLGTYACCRFYPSCSQYAYDAFKHHGIIKGFILTSYRLLRCHPFHPGGIDNVPKSYSLRNRLKNFKQK